MDNNSMIDNLRGKYPTELFSIDETSDILTITVNKNCIKDLVRWLKDEHGFGFLTDLCGIHIPGQAMELGVVYHLHNLPENKRIRIKAFTTKDNPKMASIHEIFSAANWMERETFDFYGIKFIGHPNLIRILNVEYMDYFPLRKEYPLEDATRGDKDDRFFGR